MWRKVMSAVNDWVRVGLPFGLLIIAWTAVGSWEANLLRAAALAVLARWRGIGCFIMDGPFFAGCTFGGGVVCFVVVMVEKMVSGICIGATISELTGMMG